MDLSVMTKFILGLGLLVAACGGSDDAVQCAKSDRTGAYVAHFVERAAGTCGAIADTVLRFDGNSDQLAPGCQLDAPDVWSSDECKLDRSMTCAVAGTTNTLSAVASTHQVDSAGDKITGVESVTVFSGTGAFLCASTYDLAATRQ